MNWFRFYHGALHDPKVQALRPELFKFWVNLLCLVSQQSDRGIIPSDEEISFIMRVRGDRVSKFMVDLEVAGLIDKVPSSPALTSNTDVTNALVKPVISVSNVRVPHNWGVRQPLSDDAAGRKRDWRERTYSKNGSHDVPGHVPGHVPPRVREEAEAEADPDLALASKARASPPADGGSLADCIEVARTLFGPEAARSVEANGPDISRNLKGRFDCYAAGLRKIHADQAKPGATKIRDLHALAMNVAKRLIREGIPPEPVTVEARPSQGNSMAEKAERLRKRWGFDKEPP